MLKAVDESANAKSSIKYAFRFNNSAIRTAVLVGARLPLSFTCQPTTVSKLTSNKADCDCIAGWIYEKSRHAIIIKACISFLSTLCTTS